MPDEVLYECRGATDFSEFSSQVFPTTPRVLQRVAEVMSTVEANDFDLVDLYKNEGGADPLLIACALAAEEANEPSLFGFNWAIVSNDRAVQRKAREFHVQVMDVPSFTKLIDRSQRGLDANELG